MSKDTLDGGGISGPYIRTIKALTPAATVSMDTYTGSVFTLTPGEDETINATGITNGEKVYLVVTTSGTTSRTLTFGTNFVTTGTLATGTTSAKKFSMSFVAVGGSLIETGRTAAM